MFPSITIEVDQLMKYGMKGLFEKSETIFGKSTSVKMLGTKNVYVCPVFIDSEKVKHPNSIDDPPYILVFTISVEKPKVFFFFFLRVMKYLFGSYLPAIKIF